MNKDIQEQVKEIKRSFRQMMDGSVAQSMRQKGLQYKLNWGGTLPRLRAMADELGMNYDLAIALWKEDIRECKILATMIMPPEQILPEVVDIWMEQTLTVEVAEQAAFNLYQYLPFAAEKAFSWIAAADELPQICGYHVLSRLFMRRMEPNERGINEFLDQAICALQSSNPHLQKAAMNSIQHFARLGLVYERMARTATKACGFDIL